MRSFRSAFPATLLLLLAGVLVLAGCESELEPSAEVALETRSALEVLPADAVGVSMVDLRRLADNPHTATMAERMLAMQDGSDEATARLRDFLASTGFDPDADLHQVYLAFEQRGEQQAPSMVAYGRFDPEAIAAYVDGELSGDVRTTTYRNATIYVTREDGHEMAAAVPNAEMVVAAPSVAAVEAMLDRLAEGGRRAAKSSSLALLETVGGGDAFLILNDLTDHAAYHDNADDPVAPVLHRLKHAAASVDFTADGVDLVVHMTPGEGVSPKDLADLTRGAVAALRANPHVDDQSRDLLDRARVTTAGDDVRLSMTLPNAVLAAMD